MSTARGTFNVTVEPITPNDEVEGLTFSHMSLDKRWEGDFEGRSTGELKGLSGSLAIEIVDEQHHYTFDYMFP